jgi:hypothetical protein
MGCSTDYFTQVDQQVAGKSDYKIRSQVYSVKSMLPFYAAEIKSNLLLKFSETSKGSQY